MPTIGTALATFALLCSAMALSVPESNELRDFNPNQTRNLRTPENQRTGLHGVLGRRANIHRETIENLTSKLMEVSRKNFELENELKEQREQQARNLLEAQLRHELREKIENELRTAHQPQGPTVHVNMNNNMDTNVSNVKNDKEEKEVKLALKKIDKVIELLEKKLDKNIENKVKKAKDEYNQENEKIIADIEKRQKAIEKAKLQAKKDEIEIDRLRKALSESLQKSNNQQKETANEANTNELRLKKVKEIRRDTVDLYVKKAEPTSNDLKKNLVKVLDLSSNELEELNSILN